MFSFYAPWPMATQAGQEAGLAPLVCVLVLLLLLVLKDAADGLSDETSTRLASGLTIPVLPLAIAFVLIAGAQLLAIL